MYTNNTILCLVEPIVTNCCKIVACNVVSGAYVISIIIGKQ